MNNETRTVPQAHALEALRTAVHRMNAVLYAARKYDPDNEDALAVEMLIEAGYRASSVAMEIVTRLHLAGLVDEKHAAIDCYQEWQDWIDDNGPALEIAEDVEPEQAA